MVEAGAGAPWGGARIAPQAESKRATEAPFKEKTRPEKFAVEAGVLTTSECSRVEQTTTREIQGVPVPAIRDQLERILNSETFARSERMRGFLRFTVHYSLEGKADRLKEYLIGVEVYQKPETLDPRFDPIVRVEAGRLRSKLRDYYEAEGREDPVLINFRKRSYAPVFELRRLAGAVRAGDGDGPLPEAASVAVLPFMDLSPQGDQGCFCDSLTEEVINALTRLSGIRVAARGSVFQFKGKSQDVRRIGEQLRVGSVLEGSVRKFGPRMRITAQLNSARDGYGLWTKTFDRSLGNLFGIQEEISSSIVAAFRRESAGSLALLSGAAC